MWSHRQPMVLTSRASLASNPRSPRRPHTTLSFSPRPQCFSSRTLGWEPLRFSNVSATNFGRLAITFFLQCRIGSQLIAANRLKAKGPQVDGFVAPTLIDSHAAQLGSLTGNRRQQQFMVRAVLTVRALGNASLGCLRLPLWPRFRPTSGV